MKVGYVFYFLSIFIALPKSLVDAVDSCANIFFLFSTEVRGITNRKTVIEGYENVQAALLDYTLTCYPSVTVSRGNPGRRTRSKGGIKFKKNWRGTFITKSVKIIQKICEEILGKILVYQKSLFH